MAFAGDLAFDPLQIIELFAAWDGADEQEMDLPHKGPGEV